MNFLTRIVLVVILLAIQPFLWGYVGGRSRQLHSNQANEEQFALLSQKLIESQQAFSDTQPRLLGIIDSFPFPAAISQVVGRIEALADTKHVAIELKSIEDGFPLEAGAGKITTKRITAQATGSVESIFSFLEAMENQKEFLAIESWDIIPAAAPSPSPGVALAEGAPQSFFTMTLHIIYYFYDGQAQ